MNTVFQTQQDFDNDEITAINLLPEDQLQAEMNVAMDVVKSSISTQIVSFVNYVRVYVRANFIGSALNTNLMFSTYLPYDQYMVGYHSYRINFDLKILLAQNVQSQYLPTNTVLFLATS